MACSYCQLDRPAPGSLAADLVSTPGRQRAGSPTSQRSHPRWSPATPPLRQCRSVTGLRCAWRALPADMRAAPGRRLAVCGAREWPFGCDCV